jgi:hypothetical protein
MNLYHLLCDVSGHVVPCLRAGVHDDTGRAASSAGAESLAWSLSGECQARLPEAHHRRVSEWLRCEAIRELITLGLISRYYSSKLQL